MEDFPDVDPYLAACEQWPEEIWTLRPLLLAAGLDEQIKVGEALLLTRRREHRNHPGVLRQPRADVLQGHPA